MEVVAGSLCLLQGAIRRAFVKSSGSRNTGGEDRESASATSAAAARRQRHSRFSRSGCTIVRLAGSDASSIRGLVNYAHRFFDGVDRDGAHARGGCDPSSSGHAMRNALGVFWIDDHVYAGYDRDVNDEGKMQFHGYVRPSPSTTAKGGGMVLRIMPPARI